MLLISGFLIAFIVTKLLLPLIIQMLIKAEFLRPNFKGEMIPLGVGVIFSISSLISLMLIGLGQYLYALFNHTNYQFMDTIFTRGNSSLFLFAWTIMTLLGVLDDVFGSREASGLKGHFKKLFKEGELTTGGLKALAGGVIGIYLSFSVATGRDWEALIAIFFNAVIIALSTNAVNLLDLRPGRAGKGFTFLLVLILLISYLTHWVNIFDGANSQLVYPLIILGCLIAYLPKDLQAQTMMGDTGSNTLGITIGFTAVLVLPQPILYIYLALLIGFHILTEKYSLTKIIDKNKVLKFIDGIGR
jgi:UDP-GlcNAc:undecaprenyl-phosphate/decaprenyl-phosphate GlcNAc-1-phosphate transferase